MNPAPYTPAELRGTVMLEKARVLATAIELAKALERLAHPAAASGGAPMLAAMQAQREACAKVAREYPVSQDFGDKLARVVRATPLVGSK